ncbi:MAG: acyltransferase [Eubacteriales bacterium]|nr:acyltransferase [Eubacteriales bacterium]
MQENQKKGSIILNGKRLYEIEFLHSIAFIGVVLQHILGAYARRGTSLVGVYELSAIAVVFEIVRFAVPMFIFVSGLLLSYHIESYHYQRFLKKRVFTILVPYCVWSVAYYLYNLHLAGPLLPFPGSIRELLFLVLTGSAGYHLWYVVMIFQFVLITPLFVRALRFLQTKSYGSKAWWSICLVFVLGCLLILKMEPLVPRGNLFGDLFAMYRTRLFFSYLLFYGLGCLCGRYYENFCRMLSQKALLFWLLYFFSFCYGAIKSIAYIRETGTLSFSCVSFLNPGVALLTAASVFALCSLGRKVRNIPVLQRIFSFVDKYTFEAYLSHAMLLSFFSFRLQALFDGIPLPVFYFVLSLLTITSSLILAVILKKIAGSFPPVLRG